MSCLIIHDVHVRDIVVGLYQKNITSITDFDWIGNLRYYLTMITPEKK